jgi:hypothetical protein
VRGANAIRARRARADSERELDRGADRSGNEAALMSIAGLSCAIPILVIVPCDHPFGTEAPVDHLGRGFFFNSSQIFPSSRSNPQHLLAMKGGSDGAPSPSPVPRWNQKPRPPVRGFSLFVPPPCGEVRRRLGGVGVGASRSSSEAVVFTLPMGEESARRRQQAPPLPLGRGRPLCGRVRGLLNGIIGRVKSLHTSPLWGVGARRRAGWG